MKVINDINADEKCEKQAVIGTVYVPIYTNAH